MPDQHFPRTHRIRSRGDFQRIFKRRVTAADEWLLIFGCLNGLSHPRLGLSVSRKVGGAVVRNRWKRLIREAFRLTREQLPAGVDLVAIPRGQDEPQLTALCASLPQLACRVARKLEQGDSRRGHTS